MSKLYAVALALVVLAVPAMAADTLFQPPQDIEVNISVAQMASFWFTGNLSSLDLVASDTAPWHGAAVDLFMIGNTDFDVQMEIPTSSIPERLKLDIVTNADAGKWATYATPIDTIYSYYNPRTAGGKDSFPWFMKDSTSKYFELSSGASDPHFPTVPTSVPVTTIATYDYATAKMETTPITNLFAIYSGFGPAAADATGSATVKFTVVPNDD